MTIKFSSGLLDGFAPELSKLGDIRLRDMSEYAPDRIGWATIYGLNSAFGASFREPQRQWALSLIRRANHAFDEYEAGRTALADYTSGDRAAVGKYYRALYHFESFILQASLAYRMMSCLQERRLYERGDGSELDRMWELYNTIKHADERIESGELPPNGVLHVWITPDGLKSTKVAFTFTEMSEVLVDLANGARLLSKPGDLLKDQAAAGT